MIEQVLRDIDRAHHFAHVALRYFNVAGADPAGRSGQATLRATHLIKVACEVAVGVRPGMEIFEPITIPRMVPPFAITSM